MKSIFPVRQALRLPTYDYGSVGIYFVTLCTENRRCYFGEIRDDVMALNPVGERIRQTWLWLGDQYPHVGLDDFTVMPNHLHGIIEIRTAGLKPLGQLIGAFKTVSAKAVKPLLNMPDSLWQRGYYESILRTERSLQNVRQYIRDNPKNWSRDPNNPIQPTPSTP